MRRRIRKPAPPSSSAQGFHHNPFRHFAAESRRARPLPSVAPAEPSPSTSRAGSGRAEPVPARDGRRAAAVHGGAHPRCPAAARRDAAHGHRSRRGGAGRALRSGHRRRAVRLRRTASSSSRARSPVWIARLVRRLRDGDFAYQSHLDLHGMTAERGARGRRPLPRPRASQAAALCADRARPRPQLEGPGAGAEEPPHDVADARRLGAPRTRLHQRARLRRRRRRPLRPVAAPTRTEASDPRHARREVVIARTKRLNTDTGFTDRSCGTRSAVSV